MLKYSLKSPYVRFGKAYCDKMGLFTINEITKKHEYDEDDILEGILILVEHERQNRQGE
jgi:hypothetical protein